jgi:hypothetical protein
VIATDMNLNTAENYYKAMLENDFYRMSGYLHNDILFISPFATINNKDDIIISAKNMRKTLQDISIRSKFSANNQIMFAYDFTFSEPVGILRSAVLMEFNDNLISKIELFFDSKKFA